MAPNRLWQATAMSVRQIPLLEILLILIILLRIYLNLEQDYQDLSRFARLGARGNQQPLLILEILLNPGNPVNLENLENPAPFLDLINLIEHAILFPNNLKRYRNQKRTGHHEVSITHPR